MEKLDKYKAKLNSTTALKQLAEVHNKVNTYYLTDAINILEDIVSDLESIFNEDNQLLLQKIIRSDFDNENTTFEECENLIHLSTSLELKKEYIEELVNDLF